MKTTLDYLQDVTQKHGEKIKNDNQLAMLLGVTRQAVSQYRKGQTMSVGVALKMARALDVDPAGPVFSTMYHQAASDEERAFWKACHDTWATE